MPRSNRAKEPARELAIAAARLAADDNCEEIIVLDLRGISPVTDFFVIATGTSDRQIRSVADDIARHGRSVGQKVSHVAGLDVGDWVCMDFFDVVVHLFRPETRKYYSLETLWADLPWWPGNIDLPGA